MRLLVETSKRQIEKEREKKREQEKRKQGTKSRLYKLVRDRKEMPGQEKVRYKGRESERRKIDENISGK